MGQFRASKTHQQDTRQQRSNFLSTLLLQKASLLSFLSTCDEAGSRQALQSSGYKVSLLNHSLALRASGDRFQYPPRKEWIRKRRRSRWITEVVFVFFTCGKTKGRKKYEGARHRRSATKAATHRATVSSTKTKKTPTTNYHAQWDKRSNSQTL